MPLDIPLGTETEGYTVTIDGYTYRPFKVDSEGRLITVTGSRKHILNFYLPRAEVSVNTRMLGFTSATGWKLPFAATLTKITAHFWPLNATNRVYIRYYHNDDGQFIFDVSNSGTGDFVRLEATAFTYPNYALGDTFSLFFDTLCSNIDQLAVTVEFTET